MSEKRYYFKQNDQKTGPYTIPEMAERGLKPSSLIWVEEIGNWVQAKNIPAIVEYFRSLVKKEPASSSSNVEDIKGQSEIKDSVQKNVEAKTVHKDLINESNLNLVLEQKKQEYRELYQTFYEDFYITDSQRAYLNKKQSDLGLDQSIVRQIESEVIKNNTPPVPDVPIATTKKKSKKGSLILVIIIVVLIIGLAAWYFIYQHKIQKAYEAAMNQGNVEFVNRNFNLAIPFFNQALEIKPEDPEANERIQLSNDSIIYYYDYYLKNAENLVLITEYDYAKESYVEALELVPGDPFVSTKIKIVDSLIAVEAEKAKERARYAEPEGTYTDPRDNTTYKWVRIGTQVWMAENLRYDTVGESWCYGNNSSNCEKYGRLYRWRAAVKVAPPGWHVGTSEEWTKLVEYLGGGNKAVKKLISTSGWAVSGDPSISCGFNFQPNGYKNYSDGSFHNIGTYGSVWTGTEINGSSAVERSLSSIYDNLEGATYSKDYAQGVRCVKDSI